MPISELERLFKKICVREPSALALSAFEEYPHTDELIDFLIEKIEYITAQIKGDYDKFNKAEWGIIKALEFLPGMKAPRAIIPLINLLNAIKHDYMAIMHGSLIHALTDFGREVVEPVYEKYLADKHDPDLAGVWLEILANCKVWDDRIRQALIDFVDEDPGLALMFMGDYGDRKLLPVLQTTVIRAANRLNVCKVDPFALGARLEDPNVEIYIDGRESYIMLRDNIPIDHPDYDDRVDALDRQLLKYVDWDAYDNVDFNEGDDDYDESLLDIIEPDESEIIREPVRKVGRNEPCPCGSGRKYKHCCGK